jgi:hypothetical protein
MNNGSAISHVSMVLCIEHQRAIEYENVTIADKVEGGLAIACEIYMGAISRCQTDSLPGLPGTDV